MRKLDYVLVVFIFSSCTLRRKITPSLNVPYQPPIPYLKKSDVALVFCSGGVKGLSYIGVLEVLEEEGILKEVDFLVGCSMGSLIATLYSATRSVKKMKRLFGSYNKRNHFIEISVPTLRRGVSSLYTARESLEKTLKVNTFEELSIPVFVVSVNLKYGNLTVFGSGPIIPALWGSMALPGVVVPSRIYGQDFVDGAVISPVPIDVARSLGAKVVIVVDASSCLSSKPPSTFMGIVLRSVKISIKANSIRDRKKADVLIHSIMGKEVTLLEGQNNTELIYEVGRKAARKALPLIRQKLAELREKKTKQKK